MIAYATNNTSDQVSLKDFVETYLVTLHLEIAEVSSIYRFYL